jgi:hypothetical protein
VLPGFRCKVADCLIHMYYTNEITLSIVLNGLVLDDFIMKLYRLLLHPACTLEETSGLRLAPLIGS